MRSTGSGSEKFDLLCSMSDIHERVDLQLDEWKAQPHMTKYEILPSPSSETPGPSISVFRTCICISETILELCA